VATSTTHLGATTRPRASRSWLKASQQILGRDWLTGWLFVLPMVLLLFGLIGYPFGRAVWLSLHNAVGIRTGDFVGLQNYANLWADDFFLRAVWVTIVFTVVCVALKFAIGLGAALLIHHVPRWGSILGGLALLPYIIPDTVKALAWRVLLDPLFGAMNYLLVNVLGILDRGLPWLGSPETALPSVIMVYVWSGMPFFVILFLAGLKAVDKDQYEAAAVDGAGAWRRFLHVTLPGLRYVIIVAVLLNTIFTFNSFTTVYLLTGGGPGDTTSVFGVLIYNTAFGSLDSSKAAALGVMVFVLTLPLSIVYVHRTLRQMRP